MKSKSGGILIELAYVLTAAAVAIALQVNIHFEPRKPPPRLEPWQGIECAVACVVT